MPALATRTPPAEVTHFPAQRLRVTLAATRVSFTCAGHVPGFIKYIGFRGHHDGICGDVVRNSDDILDRTRSQVVAMNRNCAILINDGKLAHNPS